MEEYSGTRIPYSWKAAADWTWKVSAPSGSVVMMYGTETSELVGIATLHELLGIWLNMGLMDCVPDCVVLVTVCMVRFWSTALDCSCKHYSTTTQTLCMMDVLLRTHTHCDRGRDNSNS